MVYLEKGSRLGIEWRRWGSFDEGNRELAIDLREAVAVEVFESQNDSRALPVGTSGTWAMGRGV